MKWTPITETPMPIDTPILVTDGKDISLCKLGKCDILHAIGVYGYEYDLDVTLENITHWMLAPELP
jgi:hypothetical protein